MLDLRQALITSLITPLMTPLMGRAITGVLPVPTDEQEALRRPAVDKHGEA